MESKLLLQTDNLNNIVKARRNFKKSPKERITDVYVQVRLEALEKLWDVFTNTHKMLIEKFGSQLSDHEYLKNDMYDEAEECYLEYKTELKSVLLLFCKDSKDEKVCDGTLQDETKCQTVQLPKIVIPKFSGNYEEWICFRDLFISLVHSNSRLSNVQKIHYLKSYLTGEAEQLIRQIPIADDNYERCWSLLKARYNNKRYLSHNIIRRLLSQKNITAESAYHLKELVDTTSDCLSGLANLGIDVANWDIMIIHILTLKLDLESRKQWEFEFSSSNSSDDLPTYRQFKDFLTNRYRALEYIDNKPSANRTNVNNNSKLKSLHVSEVVCSFCSEDTHRLSGCKKFSRELVNKRRDFVTTKNLCFNCLGNNHTARACRISTKCKLCHRRHHTLLHPNNSDTPETTDVNSNREAGKSASQQEPESPKAGSSAEKTETQTSVVSCFSTGKICKQVLLATALVKAESKFGNLHVLRALLDQGSQANFVTESTVQDLKLKKISLRSKISGLGGDQELLSKSIVYMKIRSRVNPHCTFTFKAHVLTSITTLLPTRKLDVLEWSELGGIDLADPKYHQPNKIDLLLGAEMYSQIINEGLMHSPTGSLIAQSTALGWILSGVVDSSVTQTEGVLALHCQVQKEEDLLKQFWELETDQEPSSQQKMTDEEIKCEELFKATTFRDVKGRYIVKLPFRSVDPGCKYGGSKSIAIKRFHALEAKLKKNVELKAKYAEVMQEYLLLGHMKPLAEADIENKHAVYLPHHAVVRDDKDTTKVRVVFDASCKGSNGVSLNDDLMIGPGLQPDLRHLLIRWRTHRICLISDIIKMYRMVRVANEHTDFQRIVWRDHKDAPIKDYKLLTVTFGTSSAPFLAVRAMQQVAYDEGAKYPLAAERVLNDYYMDDLLTGCDTIEEGIQIYSQMEELLAKAGFSLQKWSSNSDDLLEKIIGEKCKGQERVGKEIDIKQDAIIKTLGLTWNRSTDAFQYSVKLSPLQEPVTKRKVLSDIARLFDPLGWVAPVIVLAKMLIQKLWISGITWDEEIPSEIKNEWYTYRSSLGELKGIAVPRWVSTNSSNARAELHGFCDASKSAYAAVIYLRVIDSTGNIQISLVTAKTKVAPIKQVSIPRLELCGAVLLKRLLLEVSKVLHIENQNVRAWTDSTIVLAWLNGLPNKWKVFVANRVSEILTSLDPWQWSHVPTKQNPADCASRGMLPAELSKHSLWFQGPDFLRERNIKYDKTQDLNTDLESVGVHHVVEDPDICDRYATLTRLTRVVAYCRRMLTTKKIRSEKMWKGYLRTEEINEAFETCVRLCQRKHFEEEIKALEKKEQIKSKSILKTLTPFLDPKIILRVGGRLEESELNISRKHPIILPKKSHLTHLIIDFGHRQTLHGGTQLTLSYIYNKFWIFGAKQLVSGHIRKCVTCVKNNGLTCNPLMGQLPSARAKPSRAFLRSGVDFAGPINLRTDVRRGHKAYKGYICLFVCMSTRAVHIEAVSDLTSEGFLQAFKRFVARRGHCQEVWSDNGTNFVGAAKELGILFTKERNSILSEIAETLGTNGTSWHFILPHAPNFGGLWEAGIKSVKYHLKRVVGTSTLTYEELATVLAQVEACLNSRPLSRLGTNSENTEILTPGHFLVGEPLVTPPDYNFETSNLNSLKRWQYTQRMLQTFWRKWSQEYLRQFFYRHRWTSETSSPKRGNVVLVKEDGLPPCRWIWGLVEEEHPGTDGIVRVVTIKTKNSIIKRPVSKLCLIPVAE